MGDVETAHGRRAWDKDEYYDMRGEKMRNNKTKTAQLEFDNVTYDTIVNVLLTIYRCTACNQTVVKRINMQKPKASLEILYNFCPCCGAEIVQKEEEE